MSYRRTTTLTLHVVEEFRDDEPPSLSGIPVYDTTAEEITQTRGPGLAKCGPVAGAERRRKAAK